MPAPLTDPSLEIKRLHRCMNDLVSVLALPAVWKDRKPAEILDALVDSLMGMLGLDFLYARTKTEPGEAPAQVLKMATQYPGAQEREELAEFLNRWPAADHNQQLPQRCRLRNQEISILPMWMGVEGELGFILAGSHREAFPEETEKLILNVAANQAAIAIQQAQLLGEQTRVARELDCRIAQRTADLEAANQVLRKEIAERKEFEQKLRESETFLLEAQRLSHTGGWKHDLLANRMTGTPELERIFAVESKDNRSSVEFFFSRIHPDDRDRERAAYAQALAEKRDFESDYRIVLPDGSIRYIRNIGHPYLNEAGEVIGFTGTAIDLTEQNEIRSALQEAMGEIKKSEARLWQVIDTIPILAWSNLPDGSNEFLNKKWTEHTGMSVEESHGWGWTAAMHPDDLPVLMEKWAAALSSGKADEVEGRFRRHDGEYRWFLIRAEPFHDEAGKIVRWFGTSTDIHARKLAEDALAANKRDLAAIINTIPTTAWSTRPDGYCEFLNSRWLDYAGMSATEAEGWGWSAAIHPDDTQRLVEYWQSCLSDGRPVEVEARMRRFDGEYRWFLFRANPMRDEAGNIVKWYGTNIDIHDRKQAEEELRRSEARHRVVVETANDAVISIDESGIIMLANPATKRVFGYAPDDLIGKPLTMLMPASAGRRHQAGFERYLKTGQKHLNWQGTEFTARRANGEEFPVEVSFGETTSREEKVFTGFIRDISEKKRAEEAVLASQRNLSLTINTMPVLAWSTLPDGSADFFNQRWLEYTGLSMVEAQGWGWSRSFHPDDLERVTGYWQSIIVAGVPGEIEARLRQFDGSYRWFLFRGNPLRDDSGAIVKWYGTNTDIHDRKLAEEKVRRSEAFLAEAQHLTRLGSFSWRVATGEIKWSEQLYRIFEFDPDSPVTFDVIGTRVHPDDLPMMHQMIERAQRAVTDLEYEHRLLMSDGSIKHLHLVAHASWDQDGELEYIGAVQDVTQRQLAEAALSQARSELAKVTRATSLGILTASIAHEVNQPLSGIVTNASTCFRMLSSDPPNIDGARETVRRTIRDGNRASEVVARLRALFKKREVTVEPVDLNEATREVIALFLSELQKNRVILQLELADHLPIVHGDRVQLQQVVLNLLRNASEAMAGIEDRPRRLLIRTEQDVRNVRLTVQDSGIGLAPQDAERLFESFFTTKEDGMGIGLSVSRSIIEAHHGRLWATANEGPGATFAFTIPFEHSA